MSTTPIRRDDLLIDPPEQDQENETNALITKLAPFSRLISTGELKDFPISVRDLITGSGFHRRTDEAEKAIEEALNLLNLKTTPDFRDSNINTEIILTSREEETPSPIENATLEIPTEQVQNTRDRSEHILTVGRLEAANRPIVSVPQSTPIEDATTLMWKYNYSQIPVMQGERTALGMLTWQSITRWTVANGKLPDSVDDCLEPVIVVKINDNLFNVMQIIIDSQSVLVKGLDNKICGIITSSDLSYQFREISEAFITIGQIEAIIRIIIEKYYPVDLIKKARNPDDKNREINSVDDLTFGEYKRLFENKEDWKLHLKLGISRKIFIETLDEIRTIRNDVMHFNPDGVDKRDIQILSTALRFFDSVKNMAMKI